MEDTMTPQLHVAQALLANMCMKEVNAITLSKEEILLKNQLCRALAAHYRALEQAYDNMANNTDEES